MMTATDLPLGDLQANLRRGGVSDIADAVDLRACWLDDELFLDVRMPDGRRVLASFGPVASALAQARGAPVQ